MAPPWVCLMLVTWTRGDESGRDRRRGGAVQKAGNRHQNHRQSPKIAGEQPGSPHQRKADDAQAPEQPAPAEHRGRRRSDPICTKLQPRPRRARDTPPNQSRRRSDTRTAPAPTKSRRPSGARTTCPNQKPMTPATRSSLPPVFPATPWSRDSLPSDVPATRCVVVSLPSALPATPCVVRPACHWPVRQPLQADPACTKP